MCEAQLNAGATSSTASANILSLPNELLGPILLAGLPSQGVDHSYKYNFCVSQISRRLRLIALDTPLLWSHINARWPKNIISLFLERSRSSTLSIAYRDLDNCYRHHLDFLLPQADRWSTLRLELPAPFQRPCRLVLPQLKELFIDFDDIVVNVPTLIRSWTVPSLRHLTTTSALVPLDWFRSVRTFDFSVHRRSVIFDLVGYLIIVFQNAPHLESLKISVHHGGMIPALNHMPNVIVTTLPNLREISIHAKPIGSSLWIAVLFGSIKAPHLSSIDLDLHYYHSLKQEGTPLLTENQSMCASTLAPETLKLSIHCLDYHSEDCRGEECDTRMSFWTTGQVIQTHRLKSLTVEGRHIRFSGPLEDFWSFVPHSVESLHFINCVKFSMEKLHGLMRHLGWHRAEENKLDNEGTKTLELKSCSLTGGDEGLEVLQRDLGEILHLAH